MERMKSKEEIFGALHGFQLVDNNATISLTKNHIFEAMEEYANQSKWISVNDNLPKLGQLVLCSNNESNHPEDIWVVAGQINDDGLWYNQFQDDFSDCSIIVTHWQPLPTQPTK